MPKKVKKIYVLDTSVIIHDHNSLMNFEDNDIAIPITVLEELDNFKKGHDNKNFEAREFTRMVDKLSSKYTLNDWIPLGSGKKSKFKIVFPNPDLKNSPEKIFDDKKGGPPDFKCRIKLASNGKRKTCSFSYEGHQPSNKSEGSKYDCRRLQHRQN